MRRIADSFVVAPPKALNAPAKLRTTPTDHDVLTQIGLFLGQLKCKDWVDLLAQQATEAEHKDRVADKSQTKEDRQRHRTELKKIRKVHKRARRSWLTQQATARWADAIMAANDQQLGLSTRNLYADRRALRASIRTLKRRLSAPVGEKTEHGVRGYATKHEHAMKQIRLDHKESRLLETQHRIDARHPSVQFGGKDLAQKRNSITDEHDLFDWRCRRLAERMFLKAPGDRNASFGNQTIRCNPASGVVAVRLPNGLAHLSNTPGGVPTYVFENPMEWYHRKDEWAAHVHSTAVQYEITYDCDKLSWYIRATWQTSIEAPELEELRRQRSLSIDLNGDHLACYVQDECGNFVGAPLVVPIATSGNSSKRQGNLKDALATVLDYAVAEGCVSLNIEDLNFEDARDTGKETMGRGARGKSFRRVVAGIPTAQFRSFASCMTHNKGLWVIAVDPAYTSKHGRQHWLRPINSSHKGKHATSHHAACVAIGRRAHGLKVRRKAGAVTETQRNIRDEHSSSPPERDVATGDDSSPVVVCASDGALKRVGAAASQLMSESSCVGSKTDVAEPSLSGPIRGFTVITRSEGHSSARNLDTSMLEQTPTNK